MRHLVKDIALAFSLLEFSNKEKTSSTRLPLMINTHLKHLTLALRSTLILKVVFKIDDSKNKILNIKKAIHWNLERTNSPIFYMDSLSPKTLQNLLLQSAFKLTIPQEGIESGLEG
jgi:hypothetical protein